MTTSSCPEAVAEKHWRLLEKLVTASAAAGFTGPDLLRDQADDLVEGDDDYASVTPADLDALVDRVVAERRAVESTWTEESDSDRLDQAFAELEERGILARMNFTCCRTCGSTEIGDERDDSRQWRGYTFFHQQDADSLGQEDDTLYLSYGVFRPDDLPEGMSDADLEERWRRDITGLANEIVATLCARGLDASWNQDISRRVQITISDWRRRMPSDG